MYVVSFDITARLVVAAAVLLTSGGTRGMRHAHSGGDRPHKHNPIVEHGHSHPHHGDSRSAHHNKELAGNTDARPAAEISNAVGHLHFSWLGVDFTLPAPVNQNESDDGSSPGSEIGVVRIVDTFVPTNAVAAAPPKFASIVPSPPGSDSLIWDQTMGRFSNTPAVAIRLCDTARHERSGVQLF